MLLTNCLFPACSLSHEPHLIPLIMKLGIKTKIPPRILSRPVNKWIMSSEKQMLFQNSFYIDSMCRPSHRQSQKNVDQDGEEKKQTWTKTNMNVPPHLLSFACSFTQEALGGCGWQCVIVIEVCSRDAHKVLHSDILTFTFSFFLHPFFFSFFYVQLTHLGSKTGDSSVMDSLNFIWMYSYGSSSQSFSSSSL